MLHHVEVSIEEQLILSSKFKKNLFSALIFGLVLFIVGVVLAAFGDVDSAHGAVHGASAGVTGEVAHHGPTWLTRMYAILWHNSIFFTGIAAMGLFFVCVQYVAWAGWSSVFKRIPEAFGSFLPFAFVSVIVVFLLGNHDLFHWTHQDLYDLNSPNYDSIIAGKAGYLNFWFFLIRTVIIFGLWYFIWTKMRKYSILEDGVGGLSNYNQSGYMSAIFLIVFAVSTSVAAWDWIMSIDTHWFSTMFGWNVFASWWVTGLSTITLVCIVLKENGYLKAMNDNHFHDLGKFIFAFSIFWTYTWFSQFLLIFYANLPEETVYFIERLHGYDSHYFGLFCINLITNFLLPFLILMTRDSKRKMAMLKIATITVILGHWLFFYMMIMPGTTKGTSGFGFMELGGLIFYASAFILIISNSLAKAKLIPTNHPMIKESLYHNI